VYGYTPTFFLSRRSWDGGVLAIHGFTALRECGKQLLRPLPSITYGNTFKHK
jgi:hypothetical protein